MRNHSAARPLRTKALAIEQRLHGSEHSETLIAKSNLASTHMDMGSTGLALFLCLEVLEIERRVLGSVNRETLATMGNVASLHTDMGNNELALPLHRETLENERRVLGSQHPDTLMSILNLGMTLGNAGDHAATIPLLQEALAGLTLACGPEHPTTRTCKSELEDNEQCLADPQAAADRLRKVQFRRQQVKAAVVHARILPVASKPEHSNTAAHVLRYKRDKERYVILLQPELGDAAKKSLCSPVSLVLTVGTSTGPVGTETKLC